MAKKETMRREMSKRVPSQTRVGMKIDRVEKKPERLPMKKVSKGTLSVMGMKKK